MRFMSQQPKINTDVEHHSSATRGSKLEDNTVNSWFKKVHFSFLKSRVVWFKKDLCNESNNQSSKKFGWICNLRPFLNQEFTVFMKLLIRNSLNKPNLMTPQNFFLLSRIPSCNQHQQLLENWDAREKKKRGNYWRFPKWYRIQGSV